MAVASFGKNSIEGIESGNNDWYSLKNFNIGVFKNNLENIVI